MTGPAHSASRIAVLHKLHSIGDQVQAILFLPQRSRREFVRSFADAAAIRAKRYARFRGGRDR